MLERERHLATDRPGLLVSADESFASKEFENDLAMHGTDRVQSLTVTELCLGPTGDKVSPGRAHDAAPPQRGPGRLVPLPSSSVAAAREEQPAAAGDTESTTEQPDVGRADRPVWRVEEKLDGVSAPVGRRTRGPHQSCVRRPRASPPSRCCRSGHPVRRRLRCLALRGPPPALILKGRHADHSSEPSAEGGGACRHRGPSEERGSR